jgi:hypothetical protein
MSAGQGGRKAGIKRFHEETRNKRNPGKKPITDN